MKNNIFITALVSVFILSSCGFTRYIYTASPPNNPYFTKKGQSKLAAYYSNNGAEYKKGGSNKPDPKTRDNGADIQAAYPIGNNWAITAGYYQRSETDFSTESSRDLVVKYKRDLYDVGGGFFIPLNAMESFTFNAYAGFAFGKFSFTDQNIAGNYDRFHNASITKYYIQPSFSYIGVKYLRFSFILKTSLVKYGNIQTNYSESEKETYGLNLIDHKIASFFEPAWNLQFGLPQLPWVKLDATASSAYSFRDDIEKKINYRGNNVSIGLSFDISEMKKKNK